MNKAKSRRDFLEAGMRVVLFSSLAFTGIFLGRRNRRNGKACRIDLPCRSCPELRDCQESKAQKEKQRMASPVMRKENRDG